MVDEITQHFPKEKFQSMIPRNVRLSEAPSYGLTILEHEARSPGALAYKALAEEVIERATVDGGGTCLSRRLVLGAGWMRSFPDRGERRPMWPMDMRAVRLPRQRDLDETRLRLRGLSDVLSTPSSATSSSRVSPVEASDDLLRAGRLDPASIGLLQPLLVSLSRATTSRGRATNSSPVSVAGGPRAWRAWMSSRW